ncbi:VOC family protein [Aliikangiella sp. IMCC44359]|uniref:VOC family protein n=1 Tax=Aliikangiella sp. IMCC44359 TaxID=3459125 RepID=UPI00403B1603
MKVDDIRVFIPSKDYELSKSFYQALGFNLTFESSEVSELVNGECSFLLQNFYQVGVTSNLMIQLSVLDIEQVHSKLQSLSEFNIRFKPPKNKAWGKVIYLWGPSGELWHITEFFSSYS